MSGRVVEVLLECLFRAEGAVALLAIVLDRVGWRVAAMLLECLLRIKGAVALLAIVLD